MPQIRIIIEGCAAPDKCVLTCSSCISGRHPMWLQGAQSPAVRLTAFLDVMPASCWNKQLPDGMLSYCFYRERNKALCSEDSGRTQLVNPSQLLFVWVLWWDEREDEKVHVSSGYHGGCRRVCTGFKIYQKNKQRKVFSENVAKVPTQDQRMI